MVAGPGTASYALVNAVAITMAPLAARVDGDSRVSDDDLGIVRDATIVVRDGRVHEVGSGRVHLTADLTVIDGGGCIVMPGFVDAHTHALFAGDRVADFEALARGEPPSLGIGFTVAQTRKLDEAALVALGRDKLAAMLAHGTTTAEMKTGYALSADGEVRLLRAIAKLDTLDDTPHVVATFCGAHALPPEFTSYDAFVDELVARILPPVATTGIARFADAFCEQGFFSPAQSRRFLEACAARGLQLRIHADELSHSGGAALAAQLRCTSADHLNHIASAEIPALRAAGTTAVLCPATAQYMDLPFAPARALIDGGVPVALATDFNPGTCPCFSLQEVAHLARRRMRMSVAETIAGVSVFPARSLDAAGVAGCIAPGRPADLVQLETKDYREFGYYFGVNLVTRSFVGQKGEHVA